MNHNIKLIKKEQQQTNQWAGGTTTQLAIYPETASYMDRSFIWRLSTAVVELEVSDFTKLPGFDRLLMVLEGTLRLQHKEHHEAVLLQYQQDCFKGAWDTVSFGKARDFNLMLKEGVQGSLKHYAVTAEEKKVLSLEHEKNVKGHYACYVHKGSVRICADEQTILLQEGDMLVFEWHEPIRITMQAAEGIKADIIEAHILA